MDNNTTETKKCKHCQSDIPSKAKVCPVCRKKQEIGIFYKILIFILVLLILGSFSSKKDSNSDSTVEKEKVETAQNKIDKKETKNESGVFEYDSRNAKFLKSEIVEREFDGEKCLVVYFEYTNNADEPKTFSYTFNTKVYQNGVQLDDSWFSDTEELKNSTREVQKGTTITVAEAFKISDEHSPVTVEIRPFNVWSDKLLSTFTIELE